MRASAIRLLMIARGSQQYAELFSRPEMPPGNGIPMRQAEVSRNTLETRITVRLNLDGSGRGSFATGVPFLDHMLEQISRHGLIDLELRPPATCTSTHITPSRISASRSGRRWPGPRRQEGACVVTGTRMCRSTKRCRASWSISRAARASNFGIDFTRSMIGTFDVDLGTRILPGLRQSRGCCLHVDNLKGRQRAPPGRDGIQGVRPCAAHGRRARPARRRHDALHQGRAVIC
jgi:imidazoleglycerol-phosphate dehydratase